MLPLAPAARASTLVQLGLRELCQRATLVVAATPIESMVVWEDSSGARGHRIVTYTHARVDRVIAGAASAELWIRTLGGSIGDIGQQVDGEAVLAPGQPGLFFLRQLADGPHGVVGMSQGQFTLDSPSVGPTTRVWPMPSRPRLLARAHAKPVNNPTLEGKTLDQATQLITQLILAARQAHATP